MTYLASQAKPDTQRLFEELAELASRPLPERDELSVARLRRRAERLRQADPPGAQMALGALGAVAWDVDLLRRGHERSLQMGGRSESVARSNYAVSLQHVNLNDEAAEQAIAAYRAAREDVTLLTTAIEMALRAGRLDDVEALLADADRQILEDAPPALGLYRNLLQGFREHGIDDAGARAASRCVFGLLHERRVPWRSDRLAVRADGVGYLLRVLVSTDEAADLNVELAVRFADAARVPPDVMKRFSVVVIGLVD